MSYLFLPFFIFLVGIASAPMLAHALAPPHYPGSQLVDQGQSGAVAGMWEWSTYHTPDSLPEVLLFMEAWFPGFAAIEGKTEETAYQSSREDTSALARIAAENACSSLYCQEMGEAALSYPSASVTLYPAPDGGTIIEIRVSWPAP
ncbi:MAG: hypothetical protein H0T73_06855 [Ardenticatenales bacterium]|nr:hypothetical protein [Ardenticatenales bacterium]